MADQLTVGSLFSGIGGLDLGLERAGMRVVWQSEIDPYASKVLSKHWPEVTNHGDIKNINWETIEKPDVICGGYPCQPFSKTGKRKGTDDPRHLWPWVKQAISQLRPRYAILENVRGHLSLGGTTVVGELTDIGYNCEWRLVSAASVEAPHLRERVFIVAYPNSSHAPNGRERENVPRQDTGGGDDRSGSERDTRQISMGSTGENTCVFATQPQPRNINWQTEPNVGRVADGIPSRVDRLKGLGNAVVPQVAELVGRLVVEHHAVRRV